MKKPTRKLSNYLVDRGMQLRYIGFVAAFSALLCGTLGYLIWMQEVDASKAIVDIAASSGLPADVAGAIASRLSGDDGQLVTNMVGAGVGLVVVLSLYLLLLTHKVAGPLYKMGTYLSEMEEGRMGEVYPIRSRDMLHEFYEQFQACHSQVRKRFGRDNQFLAAFVAKLEALPSGDNGVDQAAKVARTHVEARARSLSLFSQ